MINIGTPLMLHELLKAGDLYKLSCMTFYNRYKNKAIPEYFQDMLLTNENISRPAIKTKKGTSTLHRYNK